MNEVGVQRAIKKLISEYSDVLTEGHYLQGTYMDIKEFAFSAITPPKQYYHVKIQVIGVEDMSFPARNIVNPTRNPAYDCMVHVVSLARSSGISLEEPYLKIHTYFRSMVEGMVASISGSYWASPINGTYYSYFEGFPVCIEDPDSDLTCKLVKSPRNDRLIRVQNLDSRWLDPDNEVWVPLLYSTIQFRLEERP